MKSNDEAWEVIFQELNIIEHLQESSLYPISAKQIKDISNREARLMAKFDTKDSLPNLFKNHSLNINATSNGSYIIFSDPNNKSFIKLPDYKQITPVKFKPQLDFELQTLTFNSRMSESNAIDFAHHSGVLFAFSGEHNLKLTTRGRFFSDHFAFQLGKIGSVNVKGVQIEVDAGYEGQKQFLIIEAKSSTRDSFNIRQLYYPYRHFQSKTNKKIRTVLLSFSNGIYYFTEVCLFADYYAYEIVSSTAIEVELGTSKEKITIKELLHQKAYKPQSVPVPQADDINKVIDLSSYLVDNPLDKFSIASFFEFDERQGDYYGNAGFYIGLLEKRGTLFYASELGVKILSIENRVDRNLKVVQAILKTELFNDLLTLYVEQGRQITDQQIIQRLIQEGLTGTTPARRKSTIKSWLNWIDQNLPEK
jgi:hypothetical protein